MEISFNLPDDFDDKELVLCHKNLPEPIAYLNIYEKGDVWLKIQGCETCSIESKRKCCNGCPMYSDKGCYFHMENDGRKSKKPYHCVVYPDPSSSFSHCQLEYKCIRGSKKGQIRKVRDRGNIFE